MERTITGHKIFVNILRKKDLSPTMSLETELTAIIDSMKKCKDINKIKIDIPSSKKVMNFAKSVYDKSNHVYYLMFNSAKYDQVRDVVDTTTMHNKGKLKGKKDGDLEKTHLAIKFIDATHAYCLFEKNKDGVGHTAIIDYLNKSMEAAYKGAGKTVPYKIVSKNVVSKDFLKSLEAVKKINVVTLTVDEEDVSVSDFAKLSGRSDVSKNFDIVLKPAAKGKAITKNTVKDFFDEYNKDNNKVKCITVKDNGSGIRFDTEQMKFKLTAKDLDIEVGTNEVKTESIFEYLKNNMVLLEESGE